MALAKQPLRKEKKKIMIQATRSLYRPKKKENNHIKLNCMQKIIDHHKYHANLRNRGREKEQKKKKRKSTQSPICTSLSI